VRVKEREADVARVTGRADRVEAELEAQREALRDAEDAVARERAVLQRRLSEVEERADAQHRAREDAVRQVSEQAGAGKKSLLRRDGTSTKAVEDLHASLREREIELQNQERRLSELSTALQRREADLSTMARKLQSGAAPAASDRADDEPRPRREDLDPTQKRLQFWSR
jgi:chromosome segregation ATPase